MPEREEPVRLAIFISGRGSNMKTLVEACLDGDVVAKPVLVLSNSYSAAGLEWASEQGLPIAAIDHRAYDDRESFEKDVQQTLELHNVEFIALAGFMRVLTSWFTEHWEGRMINIHPSLLPKYPGLHTHKRAIEAGDAEAGCSVHWVTEGVDEGAVIDQERVAIQEGDTPDTLAERVLEREHILYPRALAKAIDDFLDREAEDEAEA
ncbi:phosphoribosylglycinamide formyltransferase [Ponticaulis sp.]|uniref:phosphoribosylglycinamide formyltransferase n=1 Tax=Ponticaulis sp. TaxID=2020902 RepID=UPI000B6728D1|nr:phosphoribosylglycinamide formyltransferase [Ponticaulis sp.]MAJ09738.1 phosphoribosylglycinamide formyltransferase [Ponticaulis sp.]RPG17075.1 MAG: phosphoribosylglycinamide formyltransferase [Hyphomonadaceae bacterium TMED125]HBH89159.1 phosphoribosylglycinamide formyltransferase [Hyphomonadaceae bacterium]HBJ93376.1 phosphoribosylglycinamide formyltransferase [Hyphomonadaceae bacterium]|tara:strand:- start:3791 stop:4411 length:621 start_codon:yes stop_codon:yes gene_type:complete